MTDQHDERIRAFVVEMVEDPPPTPPFPEDQSLKDVAQRSRSSRKGPLVGLAALLLALLAGLLPLILNPEAEDFADFPPTAERAMELIVGRVNTGDLPETMSLFAADARCRIADVPGGNDQDCEDLFGFLIASNTVMAVEDCISIGEGTLPEGKQVTSHTCLVSFRTDIHTALGIPGDETADMNPSVHFADGQIQEIWIITPFTGNQGLDNQLWDYLASIEADYVNEEGIPIFKPEMVDEFTADAANFAALGR